MGTGSLWAAAGMGAYWTSVASSSQFIAYHLDFHRDRIYLTGNNSERYLGFTVQPNY